MSKNIILKGKSELLKPLVVEILAINQLLEQKDIGTIYGEPSTEFQARRKFKPQVVLFFQEDEADIITGYRAAEGRITFRVEGEEYNTISQAKAKTLATNIKTVFGADPGYVWIKGKELWSYSDWNKGYQLQLLCRTESHARSLAASILSIQGHTLVSKNLQLVKNQDELTKYPYTPPQEIIMGEQVRMPRYRPNVDVRFVKAALHVHGLPNAILLYSRRQTSKKALVQ